MLAECPKAEGLKDEILESFVLAQRAAHLFLNNPDSSLFRSAKKAVLCKFRHLNHKKQPKSSAIMRLPVFSKMFVVPKIALK